MMFAILINDRYFLKRGTDYYSQIKVITYTSKKPKRSFKTRLGAMFYAVTVLRGQKTKVVKL